MINHAFTTTIVEVLVARFGNESEAIFDRSELVRYLNIKSRSASRGSKSRAGFANIYAIYVLTEDYVKGEFADSGAYREYNGAKFTDLFRRQRELPFGSKLQNHALNHRLNEEFKKFFPTSEYAPVLRDARTNRYWFNENLLVVEVNGRQLNIAGAVIEIIDRYISAKKDAFDQFIAECAEMQALETADQDRVIKFIESLLRPNVDARIFEIVSFAILKAAYATDTVFLGVTRDTVYEESLVLYKTGRANANDGGIDFVMKPLGRFFQVTESLDVRKYFLDIDKIQRYPLTFVIKATDAPEHLRDRIADQARRAYKVDAIVDRYMECIEEIINIPVLLERFKAALADGKLGAVIDEIVLQSRVEFNYEEDDDGDGEAAEVLAAEPGAVAIGDE
jgi:hypothetical protein